MTIAPAKRFQAQLSALPAKPGVYVFRNAQGQVTYVGKAAALRNRLRSYFGSPHGFEPKTRRLVEAGVLVTYMGGQRLRLVTHYGIERADMEEAVQRIRAAASTLT